LASIERAALASAPLELLGSHFVGPSNPEAFTALQIVPSAGFNPRMSDDTAGAAAQSGRRFTVFDCEPFDASKLLGKR
jgi:hypothetical protein